MADVDAGLSAIVEAWPTLSVDAQRAVLEIVHRELGVAELVVTDRGT